MLTALFLALFIFNRRGFRPSLSRKPLAERIAELDAAGGLVRQSFHAMRALLIDEYEDEGLHYYLELADGRVLCLTGQYLCDFEPITDDQEHNQPRSFPCTEFEILRTSKRAT